jgi:hypothetical protein
MTTSAQLILFPDLRRHLRSWHGCCPACDYSGAFLVQAGRLDRPLLLCPCCRKRHTLADMEARAIQKDRHTEQRDQGGLAGGGSQPAESCVSPGGNHTPDTLADALLTPGVPACIASSAVKMVEWGEQPSEARPTAIAVDADGAGEPAVNEGRQTLEVKEAAADRSADPDKFNNRPNSESCRSDSTSSRPSDPVASFASADGLTETDESAIARLKTLSPFEYDRAREAEAERLGIRVGVLDKLVAKSRHDAVGGKPSGRPTCFRDVEPWPEPVDAAGLLEELADTVLRHIVLSNAAATAVALWIAHTWVFDKFTHSPPLTITSATKRCGKSTLLTILGATCRRTLKADNVSTAGVYRIIEANNPLCLLIDESDTFLRQNDELRGVLNSGFEQSGQVIRVVEMNQDYVPVAFQTYCAVALAAIGAIPGTVADRAVPVRLDRKAANQPVEKLRAVGNRQKLANLERKLARWSADVACSLNLTPSIPAALNDREGDICVALLAIADHAGLVWASRARDALLTIFRVRRIDEGDAETGPLLLADICTIFRRHSTLRMSSEDLCRSLTDLEDRPWPEWRHGRPISKAQLAAALRPFRIYPTTIREGIITAKATIATPLVMPGTATWMILIPSNLTNGPSVSSHRNLGDHDSDFRESDTVIADSVTVHGIPKGEVKINDVTE